MSLDFVPLHLRSFVATQNMDAYTPIDHAVWRYILRINQKFFSTHAHPKYLRGLEDTGIETERIPSVADMDRKLQRFGWRAIPVSGFIPPTAFMEFQALGILPIACDMRVIQHTAYTPAPDIVHEAAGHAPILVDPEYAAYLRAYGAVASKAIYNHHDQSVYEAIRSLSIVKEDLDSTPDQILEAEAQLRLATETASRARPSEAALLARMFWWTVEYGLIETDGDTKIFGAGLLSSVGESHSCWSPKVEKREFSIQCLDQSYDITKPQPQLFVTPSFSRLKEVLAEYEATMAFRVGGVPGLEKAKNAETVSTVVLDSGLQISGVVDSWISHGGRLAFVKVKGPTQLSYSDQELPGHHARYHSHGYSTPLGPVSLEDAKRGELRFPGGIVLKGTYQRHLERDGRLLVVTFSDCTITHGATALYLPEWGPFDLGVGESVPSVFGGASDRVRYTEATGASTPPAREHRGNSRPENLRLERLYGDLREARERPNSVTSLENFYAHLEAYPSEWLARLELLEIAESRGENASLVSKLRTDLSGLSRRSDELDDLIRSGLSCLSSGS